MEDKIEKTEELLTRTKNAALRIIRLYQRLPKSGECQVIGKQLLKSGTSMAANNRSACRARSKAEFFSKICIVVEETDETIFWIELLAEAKLIPVAKIRSLHDETIELLSIFSATRKTISRQTNKK
ncbi:MAG: four helix bundle protein [Bacteroidales bacterium]|nr:four helix bundle protein [Bacteroidales bacterium]HNW75120.1 four helix bundle protein [Bacteroidales bacterium]HPS51062.1 four helix bundle protein [Bacteroidales bacterium]